MRNKLPSTRGASLFCSDAFSREDAFKDGEECWMAVRAIHPRNVVTSVYSTLDGPEDLLEDIRIV